MTHSQDTFGCSHHFGRSSINTQLQNAIVLFICGNDTCSEQKEKCLNFPFWFEQKEPGPSPPGSLEPLRGFSQQRHKAVFICDETCAEKKAQRICALSGADAGYNRESQRRLRPCSQGTRLCASLWRCIREVRLRVHVVRCALAVKSHGCCVVA